jgi:hypothetical protein
MCRGSNSRKLHACRRRQYAGLTAPLAAPPVRSPAKINKPCKNPAAVLLGWRAQGPGYGQPNRSRALCASAAITSAAKITSSVNNTAPREKAHSGTLVPRVSRVAVFGLSTTFAGPHGQMPFLIPAVVPLMPANKTD